MSNAESTSTPWTPTAGKRAYWPGHGNVTVRRVYKGGTCTIQYWGRGCLEGKLVNHRGFSVSSLGAPRVMGGLDPVTGERIWTVAA